LSAIQLQKVLKSWAEGLMEPFHSVFWKMLNVHRSDGVLNPSGVRFGSGEIYTVLEKFVSVIDDSLCVGQRRERDEHERVILFLKMRPGQKLTKVLDEQIRREIRQALSPRHVPTYIFPIEEIPVSGKFREQ
jgi:acetoacetyl-CoA synthetase